MESDIESDIESEFEYNPTIFELSIDGLLVAKDDFENPESGLLGMYKFHKVGFSKTADILIFAPDRHDFEEEFQVPDYVSLESLALTEYKGSEAFMPNHYFQRYLFQIIQEVSDDIRKFDGHVTGAPLFKYRFQNKTLYLNHVLGLDLSGCYVGDVIIDNFDVQSLIYTK